MVSPIDYRVFTRELHKSAAEKRQPVNGTFELTARCNLSCRMCYISQSPNDTKEIKNELTASQWLALAEQAVDNGMVFLLLTGGEVFLRPDFFEIYLPLTRMGLVLTLFTNGTFITEKIAARLAKAPPSRTEITIYGATKKTYEMVTGVPGSFDRCMQGIELLIKHRIPLGLKTTLTRQNVSELDSMRKMAQNWGLPFTAFWLLIGRTDTVSPNIQECRMTAFDCIELEATDRASATDWTEKVLRKSSIMNDKSFYCYAGQAFFVINPRGEMNVCQGINRPAPKPLSIGFNSAWEEIKDFVSNAPPLSKNCLECNSRSYCPLCPAWSFIETGTLNKPVQYLCEIAMARKDRYDHKL